ncbi:MAG: helix-turn-helix transcriptional regulator [Leptolyngbyaceae cyanobacterium SM1_3_5]|nr:helix-turn-helix transcriptional regulator [Leptolyngbyaceae cyanobacterium SM1_3_5]
MNTNGLCGELYAESLANLFAIHLLRHYCAVSPMRVYEGGLSAKKLQCALEFIQANLAGQLSLEAIAAELSMSQYHFCKLFKQSIGVSPWQYVIWQRVERAKMLLKNREMAIADVALACGFSNQTHLNKQFQKWVGLTPNAYRMG